MPTRLRVLRAASGKFGFLLLALVVFLVTAPVLAEGLIWRIILAVFGASVLVAGLYAAQPRRRSLVLGLVLASVDLAIGQLANIDHAEWLLYLQVVLWLGTLIFVTVVILEVVLASRPVTAQTLQAAFCVFLLLGLIWIYLYMLIELIARGSFQVPGETRAILRENDVRRLDFLRFLILSYSTLTSRPGSDLVAVGDFANICGCLQSMMAQVYLAVVIARLVGLQASQTPAELVRESVAAEAD
jgi:voltage-gated potassium channel